MKFKSAKVQKANCGASVKAAGGGYMKVAGNGIPNDDKKKQGYSKGGYATKKK